MDKWTEIRRRALVDGQSMRQLQREFHLHWKTLRKILDHPQPPGYRQQRPRPKPRLGPFLPVLPQSARSPVRTMIRSRDVAYADRDARSTQGD